MTNAQDGSATPDDPAPPGPGGAVPAPGHLPDPDGKDRSFVTALARGLQVLACFRPQETYLTNTDIAERTGLPKATVSRLTHTLRDLGYLAVDRRTGSYRLDSGVLTLGYAVLSGISIADRAQAELDALRDGPNSYVTAGLAERHKLAAVYVAASQSRQSVALTASVGMRLPLFFSAAGLAILARMGEAEQARAVEALKSAFPTKAAAGIAALEQAKGDFARLGYIRAFRLWRDDVNGIAVPILSPSGRRIYAINAGGPAFAVAAEVLESDYAPRLRDIAARLGRTDPIRRDLPDHPADLAPHRAAP